MVDVLTPAQRTRWAKRNPGKNTKPELTVRSALHVMGYRYGLHVRTLPGTPDIVLRKYRTVIFVHGCYWHRHPRCKFTTTPKTRVRRWRGKFAQNIARHRRVAGLLRELGWQVIVVWGCRLRGAQVQASTLTGLDLQLRATASYFSISEK